MEMSFTEKESLSWDLNGKQVYIMAQTNTPPKVPLLLDGLIQILKIDMWFKVIFIIVLKISNHIDVQLFFTV